MSALYTANGSAIQVWHVSGTRYTRRRSAPFDALVEATDQTSACDAFSDWLGERPSWEAARVDNIHRCHTTELLLADWTAELFKKCKEDRT